MDVSQLKGCKKWFFSPWQPTPTIFFIVLLLFSSGVIYLKENDKVIEYPVQYNDKCKIINATCRVDFEIKKTLVNPIYFYYELHNFFQSHRRLMKSRNLKQLSGEEINLKDANITCDPVVFNHQMGKSKSYTGYNLNAKDIASPCGLFAKYYFNDTYSMFDNSTKSIYLNETEITWPQDKGKKFKRVKNSERIQWIDPENEHFIVWMRSSFFPNFKKLWARIEQNLNPGNYTVYIQNNYDVDIYNAKKFFVLLTTSNFGGKNTFLPWAYIICAIICIVLGILFIIANIKTKGEFGKPMKFE